MEKNFTMEINNKEMNRNDFNDILAETAESYDGTTGKIDLNLAGDRISENYDFWYVVKDNSTGGFKWETASKTLEPHH